MGRVSLFEMCVRRETRHRHRPVQHSPGLVMGRGVVGVAVTATRRLKRVGGEVKNEGGREG